jgi:hypothetical protein
MIEAAPPGERLRCFEIRPQRREWSEMKGFKEKSFHERLSTAAQAKQATLQRFRARPGPDDPAVVEQRAARQAVAAARDARIAEREAAKRAARAREAAEQEERAAQVLREAAAQAERDAAQAEALKAEQKAARDARYAARKARK